MNRVDVPVGGCVVSSDPGLTITTRALGSCVALVAWDAVSHACGMVHIALPDSGEHPIKARELPGYFADTGVRTLVRELRSHGARRNSTGFQLIGGANVVAATARMDIGRRNVQAVRRLLWAAGIGLVREDTGGSLGRTVSIRSDTGEVTIRSHQRRITAQVQEEVLSS